jgi:hypothetical protein
MPVLKQKEVLKDKHTEIYYFPDHEIVLLKLISTYVPLESFKKALFVIEELSSHEKITKMILDKSALRIFHQLSMEWYHIVWKKEMLHKNLRTYRKILPKTPCLRKV